jgi:hypothetical protein
VEAPILKIGGEDFTMPPVSFGCVRRAIPTINAIAAAGRASMDGNTASEQDLLRLMITAFCYFTMKPGEQDKDSFDQQIAAAAACLEEEMTYPEVIALTKGWNAILGWVGLVPASGEARAAS